MMAPHGQDEGVLMPQVGARHCIAAPGKLFGPFAWCPVDPLHGLLVSPVSRSRPLPALSRLLSLRSLILCKDGAA